MVAHEGMSRQTSERSYGETSNVCVLTHTVAKARASNPRFGEPVKIFTYFIMSLLHRTSRHRFTSETSKYYIDCSKLGPNPILNCTMKTPKASSSDCDNLPKEPNSITDEQLLTYNKQNDVEIYRALINYTKHNKTNKHIVMKIGYKDKRIHHEFKIGTLLYQTKIPGFIKYICILDCDDVLQDSPSLKQESSTKFVKTHSLDDSPDSLRSSVASSPKKGKFEHLCTNREYKEILLMPFVNGPCVTNYKWREQDGDIMKSVLKQIFFSCYAAFETIGFIHNDLHMENVFMKPTKQEFIHYGENIAIKTYGYKIVINDFDKSFVIPTLMRQNTEGIEPENFRRTYLAKNSSGFWLDLKRVFLELSIVMIDNNILVPMLNKIITFIDNCLGKNLDYKKSFELLNMIDAIVLVAQPKPTSFVYDPNVFG